MIKKNEHWVTWIPETPEDYFVAISCIASSDVGKVAIKNGKYDSLTRALSRLLLGHKNKRDFEDTMIVFKNK